MTGLGETLGFFILSTVLLAVIVWWDQRKVGR